MSAIITPENRHEFDRLPGGAFFQLYVPMICPDCADIHNVSVAATVVPKEGGLAQLVRIVQAQMIEQGFRIPSEEDFAAALERMEAEKKEQAAAEEAMKKAVEAAKGQPLFFMNRKVRAGGDA